MTKKLSPHDRFTRSMMSNPKVVEEFFQKNLPENVKKAIDFSSIELQKDSFVDDNLKLQIADLLYSARFNGQPGFLYLLLEHASTPSRLLPFRMLKYMLAIMDHHLKVTKNSTLPLIYPLILYSGERPYIYSMDFFDLFPSEQQKLAKETLLSPYHLIDLTQIPDEDLKPYLWFGTMALVLKHIHDSDILPFFKEIIQALKKLENQGEESYIFSVITYVLKGQTPQEEEFVQTIRQLESVSEEKLMTIIEYLKPEVYKKGLAEGMEKGIEKGLEKGLEKGRQEERIKMAKTLLSKGVSIEIVEETTQLSEKEIKNLVH